MGLWIVSREGMSKERPSMWLEGWRLNSVMWPSLNQPSYTMKTPYKLLNNEVQGLSGLVNALMCFWVQKGHGSSVCPLQCFVLNLFHLAVYDLYLLQENWQYSAFLGSVSHSSKLVTLRDYCQPGQIQVTPFAAGIWNGGILMGLSPYWGLC